MLAPRWRPRTAPNCLTLRSSPTPEGRCWTGGDRVQRLERHAVAILADPGGPVLVTTRTRRWSRTKRGCDPRRPRRAGAGRTKP